MYIRQPFLTIQVILNSPSMISFFKRATVYARLPRDRFSIIITIRERCNKLNLIFGSMIPLILVHVIHIVVCKKYDIQK